VNAVAPSYKGFRYLAETISQAAWLYHRFPLSFREVEELRGPGPSTLPDCSAADRQR
jgi:transposase-like protein